MIDIDNIRSGFPILQTQVYGRPLVYLDNAATTHKPLHVLERMDRYYRSGNSNIHRGVHYLSEEASAEYERARTAVKEHINAASESEIVFTGGTTSAINLLASAFGDAFLNGGGEIIITEMEHHSNIVPWQVVCRRHGAALRVLPFNAEGGLDIEKLPSMLNRNTRLLSLSHVSNALGIVNPVKDIIATAHAAGVPVLVDAAQSVPHLPVDVQDMDCDFLAFSGHKMYADTGIGVLYGKERYMEQLPPYQTGGGMVRAVQLQETRYAGLPLKFEAGTPHIAGAVSLAAAIDYMRGIGIENIAEHEEGLVRYAVDRLRHIDGLTLYGGLLPRCGVLSFNLEGAHPYDTGMILDKLGIAVRTGNHCAEPTMARFNIPGTVRASMAVYNTASDIDALAEGIDKAKSMLL